MTSLDDLAGRTCLVTGSTGFVGSWLVDKLVARGARVRCLVRSTSRREFLPESGIELAVGDITDRESVRRAMTGVEYVFHVAGLIKAKRTTAFNLVNVEGTRNVLAAAAENTPSIRRVVVVSSLTAAGPSSPDQPLDETCLPRPLSPYGASKLHAEQLARSFDDHVPVTIIRPPSVYGPRDRETLLVFRVASLPLRPSMGRAGSISAIHVSDLADGIILAAAHAHAVGRTYFVTGDESPSMGQLLDLMAVALGRKGRSFPIPTITVRAAGLLADVFRDATGRPFIFDRWKAEEIAVGNWACTSALAREEIGFQPKIQLADGLSSTVAWYRKAGWL